MALEDGTRLAGFAGIGRVGMRALRRVVGVDLRDQVALVTGSSRGLGLLIARELAEQGCKLVICARDEVELERAKGDLVARGAEVLAVRCDVASRDEVANLVARATERFGRIDLLVNNASIMEVGPVDTMAAEDFEAALATNFWGTLNAVLEVMPGMRARRAGRIVNIASIGGKVAVPHLLPYTCAKFAVVGLSEGLAAELAASGISVTTVIPGLMRTGSPENALFKGRQAQEFDWFALGDALPITAMNARRAARRIVRAAGRREAVVTLSWQAKLLRLGHDLFPGSTVRLMSLVARALPGSEGGESTFTRGMHLVGRVAPSRLTTLMTRAAHAFNQYGGTAKPTPAPERTEEAGATVH